MKPPPKLLEKLMQRKASDTFRKISENSRGIDFSSNDYLGLARDQSIFKLAHQYLIDQGCEVNGATGSRLLSGNHFLYQAVEDMLCQFHHSESALIFNSGYDANVGFFSSVPQRGEAIFYDEKIHASIREGILLSNSEAFKFKHNDLIHLKTLFDRLNTKYTTIYIVTESVFSMDGSKAELLELVAFASRNNCYLVVDEAHAIGVFGNGGRGLIHELGIEKAVFARVITFGKGIGAHGAAVLGSHLLTDFLTNFARSFIYTTALPPHTLATILFAYKEMQKNVLRATLFKNVSFFKSEAKKQGLESHFIKSDSPIQSYVAKGSKNVKRLAQKIQKEGFDIKPILSPTVKIGEERLRFCIHVHNSEKEISKILELLAIFDN